MPGCSPRATSRVAEWPWPIVHGAGFIDQQRHDDYHDIALGHRLGGVRGRAQAPGGHGGGHALRQARLLADGARARAHRLGHLGLMSQPMTSVATPGELRGQRQPDLAEADDGDGQRPGVCATCGICHELYCAFPYL